MTMHLDCGIATIRSLVADDAASLARYANNRKVWLNLRDRFPHPYGIEHAQEFIEEAGKGDPESLFAIEVDGEVVGSVGLFLREDVERCSAELGYWLGEEFWARGIASAVVAAVTDWALGNLPLTRIYAIPYADNAASCHILEKCGYVLEGRMRCSAFKDGRLLDQLLYARVEETNVVRLT